MEKYIKLSDLKLAIDTGILKEYSREDIVNEPVETFNQKDVDQDNKKAAPEKTIDDLMREATEELFENLSKSIKDNNFPPRSFPPFPYGGIFSRSPLMDALEKVMSEIQGPSIQLEFQVKDLNEMGNDSGACRYIYREEFLTKFNQKFNGKPNDIILQEVDARADKLHRQLKNKLDYKATKITIVFAKDFGKCPCPGCQIIPNNQ